MTHFKSNIRDTMFTIFEVLRTQELCAQPPFDDVDEDTVRDLLFEAAKLAEGPLAEAFVDGDRYPPVFDPATSSVSLPEATKNAWRELSLAEWWRIEAIPELGGHVVPRTVVWSVAEQFLGANPALQIYMVYAPFAGIIWRNGTADQKRIAQLMIDRGWTSTMMLTEPEAGSDVGAGVTRASQQADGTWHLTGVKRFITSADHDLAENIVHLVLARPAGAGPGTKGLSLFVVPKYLFDLETGELGERNGVFVTNLESKMGLTASATCEVTLGEDAAKPAVGYLLGDVHDGMAQMFEAIEHSRMFVGSKSIATLSSGYLHALEFAKVRVQSADLASRNQGDASPVTIIHHPDVRRMLISVKSYVEGMRALLLYLAHIQDRILVGRAAGADVAADVQLNDLLLPVVKGACSERANELLPVALQVLGGSGYLKDYPLEQYIRDAKIDTLYEGTTGIQGQDFFFRKILRNKRSAVDALLTEIREFCTSPDDTALARERAALSTAADTFSGMVDRMMEYAASSAGSGRTIYLVGQHTTRLLMSAGDLLIGYLLLRQAAAASTQLMDGPSPADAEFLEGKVACARFFCQSILPQLEVEHARIAGADNALMDLSENAF